MLKTNGRSGVCQNLTMIGNGLEDLNWLPQCCNAASVTTGKATGLRNNFDLMVLFYEFGASGCQSRSYTEEKAAREAE